MKKIIILSSLFFIFDQISKFLIINLMTLNQNINVINNFFSLNYVNNYGAAFSILNGKRWVFIIIGIIMLFIIYKLIKNKKINKLDIFIYSLMIAGICGNLIDRILYGYVIDFLSFRIFGYDFAIFNFADVFIVVSFIMLIIWGKDEKDYCRRK